MTLLEVINIRTAGIAEAGKVFELCRQVSRSVANEKLLKLMVFCNARYETDISIHLQWKWGSKAGSALGKEMSLVLEELGLISHTIWVEQEDTPPHRLGNDVG